MVCIFSRVPGAVVQLEHQAKKKDRLGEGCTNRIENDKLLEGGHKTKKDRQYKERKIKKDRL